MRQIRMYLSVYPFLCKVINLLVAPIVYIVINTIAEYYMVIHGFGADNGQILGMSNSEMFLIYFCLIDIMGEYNSVGCIYRKSEPFGKLVLTSYYHRKYVLGFALIDVLRRFIYIVGMYVLPLILIYLMRSEWSLGMVLMHLSYAVLIFMLTQLAVWTSRYIRNSAYFGILMGGYLSLSVPAYILLMKHISDSDAFFETLWAVSIVAFIMGCISLYSANVMIKNSVSDK